VTIIIIIIVVVRASELQSIGRRLSSGRSASRYDLKQVVHTHLSLFTKQYKLVPKLKTKQALRATH